MARQLAPLGCAAHQWSGSAAYPGQERRLLELATTQLERRTFFGLTERYAESVQLLNARLAAAALAFPPLGMLRLPAPNLTNAGKGGQGRAMLDAYNLSRAAWELVRNRSAVDLWLYERATRLFERQAKAAGVQLAASTAASIVGWPRPLEKRPSSAAVALKSR